MGLPDSADDEEDSVVLAVVEAVARVVVSDKVEAEAVVSVLEPSAVPVAEAPEAQLADLGRSCTPAPLQICLA